MVRKNRLHLAVPAILTDVKCKTELAALLVDPTREIKRKFYVGIVRQPDKSYKDTVREELRDLYNYKCAYCERITHMPHVEHYRPKGTRLGTQRFLGYYWLAYEWSNLLPSCNYCNAPGHKDTDFPNNLRTNLTYPTDPVTHAVEYSQFQYASKFNRAEDPMLLHPEYCYPFQHFRALLNGGLAGLTTKGNITIDTVKLNDPDLKGLRRKIYEDHFADFSNALLELHTMPDPITVAQFERRIKTRIKRMVDEANDPKLDFTFYRKQLVKHIDYFFIDPFHLPYQPKLRRAIVNALRTI